MPRPNCQTVDRPDPLSGPARPLSVFRARPGQATPPYRQRRLRKNQTDRPRPLNARSSTRLLAALGSRPSPFQRVHEAQAIWRPLLGPFSGSPG